MVAKLAYRVSGGLVIDVSHPVVFAETKPRFGHDYGVGWIGFNHAESNMARAIAKLQDCRHPSEIVVSHALIVSGEAECIEAAFPKGTVRTDMNEAYFDHDGRYLVFRKPKGLTKELASRIVSIAADEIGTEYNHVELAGHVAQQTFFGWLISRGCDGDLHECVDRFVKSDNAWICSELAAYCLDQQSEYADRGVLGRSLRALTPQQLFEDEELFCPLGSTADESV